MVYTICLCYGDLLLIYKLPVYTLHAYCIGTGCKIAQLQVQSALTHGVRIHRYLCPLRSCTNSHQYNIGVRDRPFLTFHLYTIQVIPCFSQCIKAAVSGCYCICLVLCSYSSLSGWINYYRNYYRSALQDVLGYLILILKQWARQKCKKLHGHRTKASKWVVALYQRAPYLFAHWRIGVRP